MHLAIFFFFVHLPFLYITFSKHTIKPSLVVALTALARRPQHMLGRACTSTTEVDSVITTGIFQTLLSHFRQFIFIFQDMCDFEITQRLAHSWLHPEPKTNILHPVTMNFELWPWPSYKCDLYKVKANRLDKYLGQRSFCWYVIVWTHRYTHTGPVALLGPLKK